MAPLYPTEPSIISDIHKGLVVQHTTHTNKSPTWSCQGVKLRLKGCIRVGGVLWGSSEGMRRGAKGCWLVSMATDEEASPPALLLPACWRKSEICFSSAFPSSFVCEKTCFKLDLVRICGVFFNNVNLVLKLDYKNTEHVRPFSIFIEKHSYIFISKSHY